MKVENGFIYPLVDRLVALLRFCNLVELFKFIAKLHVALAHRKKDEPAPVENIISACNVAIDVYQVFKFSSLFILWACKIDVLAAELFVYYMLFSNVFTYFYYHTWGSGFSVRTDRDALNRRFISLIFAIAFYLLCYGYLYQVHYSNMISWPNSVVDFWNSIYLSVGTAFTLSSEGFAAKVQSVKLVFMIQHLIAFLFFAVILANSIPNHVGSDKK